MLTLRAQRCAKCTEKCSLGQRISAVCSSDSWEDLGCADCVKCNNTLGQKSLCDGTKDMTFEQQACVQCDRCAAGTYITNGCPTYEAGKNNCTNCTQNCTAGYYMTNNCTGTTMLDNTICSPCADCSTGEYISSPCPVGRRSSDTRTCASCPDCSDFSKQFPQGQSC